jgi:mono/diheme cytochrome c family protein
MLLSATLLAPVAIWAQGNHCVAQKSPKKMAMEAGQLVYTGQCLTCHQADGSGSPNMNPPLTRSKQVAGDKQHLIELVINGNSRHTEINGQTWQNIMPGHPEMSDEEIAHVLTYIRHNFGNRASAVRVAEVKKVREGMK